MENEVFNYNYSAKEQEEINKIREKYIPKEKAEDKMELLRKLDEGVTKKGMIIALTVGVISALILGVGMSCCMVFAGVWFVPGIIIGIVGIIGISLAYPLYNRVTETERKKIAPEIIRLTDELMK